MNRSDRAFRRAARRLLASMGGTATLERYAPAEIVPDVLAHISRDVEFQSAGQTETTERRNEAEMLVEEIGDLRKRDVIDTGSSRWKVASKISNDGFTVRVVIEEVEP